MEMFSVKKTQPNYLCNFDSYRITICCLTPLEFILAKVVQNRMSALLKCLTIGLSSLNKYEH